jgi:hypothetical protein
MVLSLVDHLVRKLVVDLLNLSEWVDEWWVVVGVVFLGLKVVDSV